MRPLLLSSRLWPALLLVAFASACGSDAQDRPTPDPDRPPGTTEFWSADGQPGQRADTPDAGQDFADASPGAPEPPSEDRGDDAEVQEGDIYRLLGDGRILNLNSYRGLQVIDFNDVANPRIIGRLAMSGSPVELYVSGDRAYVLMNNWSSYYGSRFTDGLQRVEGGVIFAVDLSDPTKPAIVDTRPVPGWIMRSRVVFDSRNASLFVASTRWGTWDEVQDGERYYARTFVASFDISAGKVQPRTELALGGYVTDIQATPRYLMVARGTDWWWQGGRGSTVTLVDISNPDGTMVKGAEIDVRGRVASQFNMDIHGNILRVVSGRSWGGSDNTNWLETFDISDIQNPRAVDKVSFGDNMDLFATIFLGNKAFFVTFFRIDPFHAFEITNEGYATEISEFEVTGWNDFFRPVFQQDRLVGIGVNDENARWTLAVSLYDITDLANPHPLLQRAEVDAQWSWSEASWDHRAFSVLEDAVAVQAADGTLETGLVLLPFSGYDVDSGRGYGRYRSAVQIFTFSRDTLTARGVMDHPSAVRRSFLAESKLTGNLSETDLSFYDVSDPDAPSLQGTVELAPNYTRVYDLGSHIGRLRAPRGDHYYGWDGRWDSNDPNARVSFEVLSAEDDPDAAEALAVIDAPSGTSFQLVGRNLVGLRWIYGEAAGDRTQTRLLHVTVWNMRNPLRPRVLAETTLDDTRFQQRYDDYGYYPGGWCDGWGCYGFGHGEPAAIALGDHLVFTEMRQRQRSLGQVQNCWWWPRNYGSCEGTNGREICTYIDGYRSCSTYPDGTTTCQGGFQRCTYDGVDYTCEPVALNDQDFQRECSTYEQYRYWQQAHFDVLSLADPSAPRLLDRVSAGETEEYAGLFAEGDRLWYSFRQQARRSGDPRPYVRYFTRALEASGNGATLGSAINLPGRLIAGSGSTFWTQDEVYGDARIESAIARVRIQGTTATLEAMHRFSGRQVSRILHDGGDLVFVAHQPTYYGGWYDYDRPAVAPAAEGDTGCATEDCFETTRTADTRNYTHLAVFDASGPRFERRADVPVDRWASLQAVRPGQAIFQVGSGLILMNVSVPTAPRPQAFLPVEGWPQHLLVRGSSLLFASGRYGIYAYDLNTSNLVDED